MEIEDLFKKDIKRLEIESDLAKQAGWKNPFSSGPRVASDLDLAKHETPISAYDTGGHKAWTDIMELGVEGAKEKWKRKKEAEEIQRRLDDYDRKKPRTDW